MASSKGGRPPQVNVSLTPSDEDVLRALMFLEGKPASEVLRPSIETFLREQRSVPEVREALAVLQRHRTKTGETNLASIQGRLKPKEGA